MDDKRIWRYIDEQRADLADFLDTLTPEQWATPSLCGDGRCATSPRTSRSRRRAGAPRCGGRCARGSGSTR